MEEFLDLPHIAFKQHQDKGMPARKVAAVFAAVNETAAFDFCTALYTIEQAATLPSFCMNYVRRAMHLYRKYIREPWDGQEGLDEEGFNLFAKFREANTWKDVAAAFPQTTEPGAREDAFFRMLRSGKSEAAKSEPDQQCSARERAKIYDHAEAVIMRVIAELNDVGGWTKHADRLEKSLLVGKVFGFVLQGISLFQSGFDTSYVDSMYSKIKAFGDLSRNLPQLEERTEE
eukprot:m.49875 g.49875  ORF g.49875 m.49875 type:complete len:231 (-) comp15088_c0_seq2:149-841(-)